MNNSFLSQWWVIILVFVVLTMFVVSSFTSKNRKKLEREKRKREVKAIIKKFMRAQLSLRHKRIEFEQVVVRSSKDYRYRDVFDVIVRLYDSKSNDLFAKKAFEVEGFTKSISKKEYETIWKVNSELDLEATMAKINLQKLSSKKLKRKDPEVKQALAAEKKASKAHLAAERLALKEEKKQAIKHIKRREKPKLPINEKFAGLF